MFELLNEIRESRKIIRVMNSILERQVYPPFTWCCEDIVDEMIQEANRLGLEPTKRRVKPIPENSDIGYLTRSKQSEHVFFEVGGRAYDPLYHTQGLSTTKYIKRAYNPKEDVKLRIE